MELGEIVSHKIKINQRQIKVLAPLPKRNKREALLKRIASRIENDEELYTALQYQPPYMREAYLQELWPYLRFTPRRPKPVVEHS